MLEFILWFILIFILFRIFAKFLLPYIIKYYLKKFQQKFNQSTQTKDPNRKEGETHVEFVPKSKSKKGKNTENLGEYIDYEELDNK